MSTKFLTVDCREYLRKMGREADIVFADPPYNIGVDYGLGAGEDRQKFRKYISWSMEWMSLTRTYVKPTASLWLIVSDEFAAELKVAANRCGWAMRRWIKWEETFGVYCQNNFGRCGRHIFWFETSPNAAAFFPDRIRVQSARQEMGDPRADPRGKLPGDVWKFSRVCGTFKERVKGVPTQLPQDLCERIVLATLPEAAPGKPRPVILDLFAGSGTLAAAALATGLKHDYIGCDISRRYTRIASERIAKLKTPKAHRRV